MNVGRYMVFHDNHFAINYIKFPSTSNNKRGGYNEVVLKCLTSWLNSNIDQSYNLLDYLITYLLMETFS